MTKQEHLAGSPIDEMNITDPNIPSENDPKLNDKRNMKIPEIEKIERQCKENIQAERASVERTKNKKPLNCHIRQADETDLHFILNSYLLEVIEFQFSSGMPLSLFKHEAKKQFINTLKHSEIIVAVNPFDHTDIFGYLVYQQLDLLPCLHFCYVKYPFRDQRIASSLLRHIGLTKKNEAIFTIDPTMREDYLIKRHISLDPSINTKTKMLKHLISQRKASISSCFFKLEEKIRRINWITHWLSKTNFTFNPFILQYLVIGLDRPDLKKSIDKISKESLI